MKHFIEKNGKLKSTVIFTLFGMILSLVAATLIWLAFLSIGIDLNIKYTAAMTVVISLLVGPIVILPFIQLILKIDKLEKEMRQLATYDTLTGLLTRRSFMEQSEVIVLQLERHVRPVCIVAIDFDDFKAINDKHGHACGDMILEVFGEVARASSRKGDILGRLGGEEFAFLLTDLDIPGAIHYLERLKQIIASCDLNYEGEKIPFTISSGIIEIKPGTPINVALRNADKALYEAKHSGKNMTVIYDEH
ncbi:MAG TPA: hypothetical protein DCS67_10010 [Clostridiales bacterium UBA8960]|jgi:diguanylate cyclase (GGDEF)-like protein|nr:hypothetical protein [Clostridiales bacterium UBA8960]